MVLPMALNFSKLFTQTNHDSLRINHLLLTEIGYDSPIGIGHSKPLAVSWPNVNVDGTEVVILLMTWCSGPWYLRQHQMNLKTCNKS